jgi:hypothetical protein
MSTSTSRTIVALVPVATHVEHECESSLRKLRDRGVPTRYFRGASAIDQARSQMAYDALADGFTELLWIDSDIAFEPEDVDKLRSHGLPFVCGIAPKKGARSIACHVLPGTDEILFGEGGGLLEILYAAGGFNLVRRNVYETVAEKLALPVCNKGFGAPTVPYYLPMLRDTEKGPWYLGEDYAFCERARQAGFSIMADTSIRLRHIGRYEYQWEDAGGETKRFPTYHLRVKA